MEANNLIYIVTACGSWLITQIIKIFISLRQDGITWQDLFASGGMPSSHVALVTSVAVGVAMNEGLSSAIFGVILTLWGVVVYDSIGVRRATGENTKMIRQITDKLKLGDQQTALFLALGHTPYQAFVGFILGLAWGFAVHWLWG